MLAHISMGVYIAALSLLPGNGGAGEEDGSDEEGGDDPGVHGEKRPLNG
jgi:hypothetical protein